MFIKKEYTSVSNDILPYDRTVVIYNIHSWDGPDRVKSYVNYLFNSELALNNIDVLRIKIVISKRGKTLIFVELKDTNQRTQMLKNKHLLRHMKLRTPTSLPIYIHPARSLENVRTKRNLQK